MLAKHLTVCNVLQLGFFFIQSKNLVLNQRERASGRASELQRGWRLFGEPSLKVDFPPCKISGDDRQSKASYDPTVKSDHWNNYSRIWSSPTASTLKTQSVEKSEGRLRSALPHRLMKCLDAAWTGSSFSVTNYKKAVKHADDSTQIRKPSSVVCELSNWKKKIIYHTKHQSIKSPPSQQACRELPLDSWTACKVTKHCLNVCHVLYDRVSEVLHQCFCLSRCYETVSRSSSEESEICLWLSY